MTMALNPPLVYGIQSTAGAVPVRNEKGELSMQKVKVHRYVSGKRPDYAQDVRSDSDSDEDDFLERRNQLPKDASPQAARNSDDELKGNASTFQRFCCSITKNHSRSPVEKAAER